MKGLIAQNLFRSSSMSFEEQEELLIEDPTVLRKRGMEIDTSELFQSLDNQESLVLNLFSDVKIQASIQKSRALKGGGSFTSGVLEDGGSMTLMINENGIVRGKVHSSRGVYIIRSNSNNKNQVIIKEIDLSQISQEDDVRKEDPEEIELFLQNFQPEARLQSKEAQQTLSENETVDVLVVYTNRARVSEGGTAEIQATIKAEVEDINQALVDSGLTNRQMNLVAMKEISYTQSTTSMGDDLDRLRWNAEDNPTSDPTGIMDEVHKFRDQYGADFVHLFVRDSTSKVCGIATIYTQLSEALVESICETNFPNNRECVSLGRQVLWSDSNMFSVSAIKASCLAGYTFAHELGHSMGIFHDRYTEIEDTPLNYDPDNGTVNFPFRRYGFGYVNQNFSRSVCWRTLMAYSKQCIDQGFSSSNRALYFSNPSISLGNDIIGYDPAGVTGSYQSTSLTGPVNASRAIDDIWDDVLIHLKPSSDSCKSLVFSDLETNTISFSFEAGMKSFTLSDVPDYCAEHNLTATSTDTFISSSTRKTTYSDGQIDFEINLIVDENSSCSDRTGQVTLTGEAGAEQILSIEQNPAQARRLICESAPSQQLANLVAVDLSNQNISGLRSFFFDDLTGLEDLDLSQNDINTLSNDIFSTLTSLRELNLSENEINSIENNAFRGLSNLEELDLSQNQISSINSLMFNSLSKLEELDLSQNQLSALQSSVFSSLSNLEELDLRGNQISSISQSLFTGLSNLEELDLSRNQIISIPANTFSQLSKLRYLWLSSNDISTLSSNVFSSLSSLRSLSLGDNELTVLPSGLFSNLSKLRYLWLNANSLTTLPDTVFSGLSRLRYLNLSYNNFTPLSDGVCTFLRGLRYVVVAGSSLDTICPTESTTSVLEFFQDIVSLENPFKSESTSYLANQNDSDGEDNLSGKIVLKMYEDGLDSSDISQITGIGEHRITNIITHQLQDSVRLENKR